MSDTPETDAAWKGNDTVKQVMTSRRMERERDEAIEKLEEEMKWHHRTHAELVQIQCKLLDTERDRDDLRDRLNELLNRPTLV
jgi:hypothetical protein